MNELNKVQDQLIKEQDLLISLLEKKFSRNDSGVIIESEDGKITIIPLPVSLEQLKAFFKRPGINMAGICKEADVSQQYVLRKFAEGVLPGEKVTEKLLKVIKQYGF